MIRIFFAFLLVLAFAGPAEAGKFLRGTRSGSGQATVTWADPAFDGNAVEPASAIADLDHCVVYWGTTRGAYTANSGSIAVGVQTYTTPANLTSATWYFAVRCYDASGNPSFYSVEGSKVI